MSTSASINVSIDVSRTTRNHFSVLILPDNDWLPDAMSVGGLFFLRHHRRANPATDRWQLASLFTFSRLPGTLNRQIATPSATS
jgi:hypothetical protein